MRESRESQKEKKSQEREDLRSIPDAFKLNLANNPDRFYEIIQGTYKPPKLAGENPRITKSIKTDQWAKGTSVEPQESSGVPSEENMAPTEEVEPFKRSLSSSTKVSKFAGLIQQLERFPFSEDKNKLKAQLSVVERSVKTAMQDLIISEVANNTKTAFGQYYEKAFKMPGGIKIAFKFEQKKFTVEAYGAFSGDETICIFAENDAIKGCVMRIAENSQDVLNDFKVIVGAL